MGDGNEKENDEEQVHLNNCIKEVTTHILSTFFSIVFFFIFSIAHWIRMISMLVNRHEMH